MKITICGSMTFVKEMESLEKSLRLHGFTDVFSPSGITDLEDGQSKIDFDLINRHWHKILKSDCILVANYDKKNIAGYIGGNTFLEMGFAFVTGKPIFMLHPIPELDYRPEIVGMSPIVINGDVSKIKEYYCF